MLAEEIEEYPRKIAVAATKTQPYSLTPSATTQSADTPLQPVALILCHGMGQQRRHETLAEAARNLHISGRQSGAPTATMCYMRFTDADRPGKGDRLLPRAEIEVAVPGKPELRQPVHVYEVYWAPLTEGQIGLSEVIWFLIKSGFNGVFESFQTSGFNGVFNSFQTFKRWLFTKEVALPVAGGTFPALFGLLLLILALVVINTVMTLVLGENLLNLASISQPSSRLVNALTWHLTILLGVAMLLFIALRVCASRSSSPFRTLAVGVVWGLLGLMCVLLLVSAIGMATEYFILRQDGAGPAEATLSWRRIGIGVVWLVASAVSWQCRNFLVQYLGDVVIYIDAYNVDRFFSIRNRIRRLARQTLEAVYGARKSEDAQQWYYQRVVIAGHSLGSLVAYDALNALLLADEAENQQLGVRDRTAALVSYGSPLDKTTFLYHAKAQERAMYTALDAARQPLIRDVVARQRIQWANLYSRADIVSGPLEYFNAADPALAVPDVLNILDGDAYTPVQAHVQYWHGGVLARALGQALSGQTIT